MIRVNRSVHGKVVSVEKHAVILSGGPGGFATGTKRRIADCTEGGGGLVRGTRYHSRRLRPFTFSDSSLRAAPPSPARRSVQNDGLVLSKLRSADRLAAYFPPAQITAFFSSVC